MVYLILVNITLTVCYLLYRFFFKKFTFFQLNRFYLLGAVIVSLLVPIGLFIDISAHGFMEDQLPTVDLSAYIANEFTVTLSKQRSVSVAEAMQLVYWSGVLIAVAWLCFRFFRVVSIVRGNQSSFSFAFFHRVVLGDNVRDNRTIVDHEQVHVAQGHSYDVLLLELVRAFNWFNPIVHHYLKEVKFQHECIADEHCSTDKVAYAELLVAQAMQVESMHFLHEFSNKSILKSRITMLFKDKSKKKYKLLYFSIAPVIMLAVLSTLVFNTSKAKGIVQDIEAKVENTTLDNMQQRLSFNQATRQTKQGTIPPQTNIERLASDTVAIESKDSSKLFLEVQRPPQPVGGFEKFSAWLAGNYIYPKAAITAQVAGSVVTSFVVEADGSLSTFRLISDMGYGTGEAAIDLLKKAEKWEPGIQNGRKVRVAYTLPIKINAAPNTAKITLRSAATDGSSDKQVQQPVTEPADEGKKVFTAVEVYPEPVGGLPTFRKWLGNTYEYPQEALDAGVKGQLVISFIVEADGALTNFKVIKDLGYQTSEAALAVLRKAAHWRPGIQNGRNVRVAYTLPITLNLSKES